MGIVAMTSVPRKRLASLGSRRVVSSESYQQGCANRQKGRKEKR